MRVRLWGEAEPPAAERARMSRSARRAPQALRALRPSRFPGRRSPCATSMDEVTFSPRQREAFSFHSR